MPCWHPLSAWKAKTVNPSGKRAITFDRKAAFVDMPLSLPCGQCSGCRLERSRQWAMRCVHEASLHTHNQFVTLTYSDDNLPAGGTLVKRDYQLFMKRLRKRFPNQKIRYYQCGEYGETTHRPHYHACIFGLHLPDKIRFSTSSSGPIFISPTLTQLWPLGQHHIGQVTFESAAYVARYIMKKITGEAAAEHYESLDPDTGELTQLLPEYTTMSRRPGIGMGWYNAFAQEVYPSDEVIMRNRPMRPPRAYDKSLELTDPSLYSEIKRKRRSFVAKRGANLTPERLAVREKIQAATTKAKPKRQL